MVSARNVQKNIILIFSRNKNIIITENTAWATRDIIEASLDRWQVEDRFRLSKNKDLH